MKKVVLYQEAYDDQTQVAYVPPGVEVVFIDLQDLDELDTGDPDECKEAHRLVLQALQTVRDLPLEDPPEQRENVSRPLMRQTAKKNGLVAHLEAQLKDIEDDLKRFDKEKEEEDYEGDARDAASPF